jgi:XXXCH domain-containing protein
MAASNSRYEEKLLKKSMSPIWKSMRRELEAGVLPNQVDWNDFWEKIERYTQTAMPEWKAQWQECIEEVQAMHIALKQNDIEAARRHMKNADAITKACHKRWKD